MIYLDADFITDARVTNRPIVRSATGYGNKIPTRYMIRLANNRWYRIYAKCWSNAASFYIRTKHAGERYIGHEGWCFIQTKGDVTLP